MPIIEYEKNTVVIIDKSKLTKRKKYFYTKKKNMWGLHLCYRVDDEGKLFLIKTVRKLPKV